MVGCQPGVRTPPGITPRALVVPGSNPGGPISVTTHYVLSPLFNAYFTRSIASIASLISALLITSAAASASFSKISFKFVYAINSL